jgi:hypothetical protein
VLPEPLAAIDLHKIFKGCGREGGIETIISMLNPPWAALVDTHNRTGVNRFKGTVQRKLRGVKSGINQ